MAKPVVKIRLIPSGKELRKKIDRLNPAKRTEMINRSLVRSGFVIAENSQKAMKRGGKAAPLRKKLTSRTGTGRRSITADRRVSKTTRGFRLDVGTELIYMGVHEDGGTFNVKGHTRIVKTETGAKTINVKPYTFTFPKRPFLDPGFKKSRKSVESIFTQEWLRIIGSA